MPCKDLIAPIGLWANNDAHHQTFLFELFRKSLKFLWRIGPEANVCRTEWVEQIKRQIGISQAQVSRLEKNAIKAIKKQI